MFKIPFSIGQCPVAHTCVDHTAQKMKFSIKDFFSKCDQTCRKLDLATFAEESLNGKLHLLRSFSGSMRGCFT